MNAVITIQNCLNLVVTCFHFYYSYMKQLFALLLFVFFFPTLLFSQNLKGPQQFAAANNLAETGFSAERLKRIDHWIENFVAAGKAPNVVVFVARNGRVVYHKAFGYSNIAQQRKATTGDVFRIASQTKAIATVALMTLFEEGRFLLDDPVSKYIPAFANAKLLVRYDTLNPVGGTFETAPLHRPITIRQLLSHTSGITYEHPLEQRPEFKVPTLNSMAPVRLADVVDRLATRPLLHEPGSGFYYGLNTEVVGRLVEVLSGDPLDVAIRKRVTEPLGMQDTYFYLPDSKKNRLVELYSKPSETAALKVHDNDTFRMYPVAGARTYFTAGAGMVSTASDYGRFCQMLLNGGSFNNKRILSPQTLTLMTSNQIGASWVWDREDKFGLGFELVTAGTRYLEPAPVGSFSWGGAYCSDYLVDPEHKLVIQTFTNVQPYAHYNELNKKLRSLIYQAMY